MALVDKPVLPPDNLRLLLLVADIVHLEVLAIDKYRKCRSVDGNSRVSIQWKMQCKEQEKWTTYVLRLEGNLEEKGKKKEGKVSWKA